MRKKNRMPRATPLASPLVSKGLYESIMEDGLKVPIWIKRLNADPTDRRIEFPTIRGHRYG